MMIIKSNPKEIIVDYGIYCLCSTVVRSYKMF